MPAAGSTSAAGGDVGAGAGGSVTGGSVAGGDVGGGEVGGGVVVCGVDGTVVRCDFDVVVVAPLAVVLVFGAAVVGGGTVVPAMFRRLMRLCV